MTEQNFHPELRRIRQNKEPTGALNYVHPCFFCGKDASFGHGVFLNKFLHIYEAGKADGTNKRDDSLLGKFTCGMDSCLVTGEKLP